MEIVRARAANQELGQPTGFQNLFDFCERIDHRHVSRAAIEKLIKAGALDTLAAGRRASLFDALPRALESAGQVQADRRHGQASLFDSFDAGEPAPAQEGLKDVAEWTSSERLKFEKEALDFYITSHPLAQHEETIRRFSTSPFSS